MLNGGFTALLLLALAATLVVAAVIDTRTFTISNRLTAGVALAAPLYWISLGVDPFPGMAIQLAAGAIVFAVLAVAFHSGMMGGGDVKLAAALAGLPDGPTASPSDWDALAAVLGPELTLRVRSSA